MDVAPYVDVYHMPPEIRLQRFLFNEECSIVDEHSRITQFFSDAFFAICPFPAQLIGLGSNENVQILRFQTFSSSGPMFVCRVSEKEYDIPSCYLKPEMANRDALRYFDDLREIGKICALSPRSSLERLSNLGSKISSVVSRSLEEELALSDEQLKEDNQVVAEIQKIRLSRGHWRRFGINRSVSDLSSLPTDDAWNILCGSGLTLDEVSDAVHHLVTLVWKQQRSAAGSLSIHCKLEWNHEESAPSPIQDVQYGAFGQAFLSLNEPPSDPVGSSFLLHAHDVVFPEGTGLPWLGRLIELLKDAKNEMSVVRRSSVQTCMNDMVSKTMLLLESRGEDDYAPAAREIAEWKLAVTDFAPFKCNYCEREGQDLLRCSKCKRATYCNPDCQRGDWKTHKKTCK